MSMPAMTDDQLPLWEPSQPAVRESPPRCRMCARPARWVIRRGGAAEWSGYCAGSYCSNPERLCQRCETAFTPRRDGANSKYCSSACTPATHVYTPDQCARPQCTKTGWGRDRLWPYVCAECRYPLRYAIPSLRKHHVPWPQVERLLNNPGCDICGIDILGIGRRIGSHTKRTLLVVDHDHSCCGGNQSCGRCVRGFLCGPCNTAIGMLHEDPTVIHHAAEYVERFQHGTAPQVAAAA